MASKELRRQLRSEAWRAVFFADEDDMAYFDTSHYGDTDLDDEEEDNDDGFMHPLLSTVGLFFPFDLFLPLPFTPPQAWPPLISPSSILTSLAINCPDWFFSSLFQPVFESLATPPLIPLRWSSNQKKLTTAFRQNQAVPPLLLGCSQLGNDQNGRLHRRYGPPTRQGSEGCRRYVCPCIIADATRTSGNT